MSDRLAPEKIDDLLERYGPAYRWLLTATTMLASIATITSATIVNVALPDIMGAFGMGQNKAQLLSTAFLAAMTTSMLLTAWMVDSFGARMTYVLAVSVFVTGSIIGGAATNEVILVLSRILQGGSAGILHPLTMQLMFQVFPPSKRGTAMGIYGIGVVLAPAFGPVLGGILVDSYSWRYVFFMAVPLCVIGLFMAFLFVPKRSSSHAIKRFDWTGFGFLVISLVSLLASLSNGQRYGWHSSTIATGFAISTLMGMGFIIWELRTKAPLIDLRLFSNRTFLCASIVSFIFGAGIYASTYLVPLFVQTIQGYSPTRSGLLMMPAGLCLAFIFPIAGRIVDKKPRFPTVVFGLAVFALSSLLMIGADTDTPMWTFAWWFMLGRIGLGFIMPGLSTEAISALPATMLSQASGAINFVRQLGGALGVILSAIYLEMRTQLHIGSLVVYQDAANSASMELLRIVSDRLTLAGISDSHIQINAIDFLAQVIFSQGNMLGYRDGFLLIAIVSLLAVIPALMIRR